MFSNSKTWRRVHLLKFVKFIGLAIVGLFAIYLIVVGPKLLGFQDVTAGDESSNGWENRVNQGPSNRVTEFEKVINSNDAPKLETYYNKLVNWPDAPIVIQLGNLEKRLAVLDELLRLNPDNKEVEQFVLAGRLKTFSDRERIAIVYDAFDPVANDRLIKFCAENEKALADLRATSMCLATISRFLAAKKFDERTQLRELSYRQFVSTLKDHAQNQKVGESLADQIRLLIDYGVNPEAVPFAVAFLRTYSKATDPIVVGAMKEFSKMIRANQIAIPSIIDIPPELRDRKIQQFQVQAEAMLNTAAEEDISKGLGQLISRTRDLVRLGRIEAGKRLANQIAGRVESDSVMKKPLDDLMKFIEMPGQPFDPSGLKNIRGGQINLPDRNDKPTVLLFVAPGKLETCETWCRSIQSSFERDMENIVFRLVLIKKNGPRNRGALLAFANKVNVKSLVLDFDSPAGKAFGARVQLDEVPFLILLDEKNRYLAVGPPVDLVAPAIGARLAEIQVADEVAVANAAEVQ